MANKGKLKANKTAKRDTKVLVADAEPNQEQAASLARTSLRPSAKGAITIKEFSKRYGDLDVIGLVNDLTDQAKMAIDGDLKRVEEMLMVQAHTLEAIFNCLAQRSINSESLDKLERYLRLALKAQSQCRTTLETLSAIKNPASVAFVRQANIGYNQQVNNSAGSVDDPSRTREISIQPNELLEAKPHERLDTRAQGKTLSDDSALEAVGEIDRPENA